MTESSQVMPVQLDETVKLSKSKGKEPTLPKVVFFFFFFILVMNYSHRNNHNNNHNVTFLLGPMTIQKRGSVFTVILQPHNTNFHTRTLELRDKVRIRIGRQTSQKTSPTAYNGYFDSKVLSRQHAEIWCDKSRVTFVFKAMRRRRAC